MTMAKEPTSAIVNAISSPTSSIFSTLSSSTSTRTNLEYPDDILKWNVEAVSSWISKIGYPQYAETFIDNNISGDILPYLTNNDLKEMSIKKMAHRLTILKNIHLLLSAFNVQVENLLSSDSVFPNNSFASQNDSTIASVSTNNNPMYKLESQTEATLENSAITSTDSINVINEKLNNDLSDLNKQLQLKDRNLTLTNQELKKLSDNFNRLREDLLPIFKLVKETKVCLLNLFFFYPMLY